MKKLTLIAAMAFAALLFTSCGKHNYDEFVGTWGAEKVEYYNIDYAGNPIAASMQTYTYDPEDVDNSIRLSVRSKQGDLRVSMIAIPIRRISNSSLYIEIGTPPGVHWFLPNHCTK